MEKQWPMAFVFLLKGRGKTEKMVCRTGYRELSQRTLGAHRLLLLSGVQFWVSRTT